MYNRSFREVISYWHFDTVFKGEDVDGIIIKKLCYEGAQFLTDEKVLANNYKYIYIYWEKEKSVLQPDLTGQLEGEW